METALAQDHQETLVAVEDSAELRAATARILQFSLDQRQSVSGIHTLVNTALESKPGIDAYLIPALLETGGDYAKVAHRIQLQSEFA